MATFLRILFGLLNICNWYYTNVIYILVQRCEVIFCLGNEKKSCIAGVMEDFFEEA